MWLRCQYLLTLFGVLVSATDPQPNPLSGHNAKQGQQCSSYTRCSDLPAACINCEFNSSCTYGSAVKVLCSPKPETRCDKAAAANVTLPSAECTPNATNNLTVSHWRTMICRYCYQLEDSFECSLPSRYCYQPGVAISYYMANCTASPNTLCLGNRHFKRMRQCQVMQSKRYGTSVMLSLFLGGIGADRFYLGMWREGLGKLFSFGGLGVWSVIDFILG